MALARRSLPQDLFSFAKCKAILPMSLMQKTGVPQPDSLVEAVEQDVTWEEFQVECDLHTFVL